MQLAKKIRLKVFIPLSVLLLLILAAFLDSGMEMVALGLIYLTTILWLFCTALFINYLLHKQAPGSFKLLPLMIGLLSVKLILFAAILYIGWQFMGKKLFIALLNLPAQTLLLGLSVRKS